MSFKSSGLRILAVEQDIALLEIFRVLSTMAGAKSFITAKNGEEALALARQHQPDVVITDIMVPHSDGLSLWRSLQAELEVQGILVGRQDQLDRVDGQLQDTSDLEVLTKPFNAERFLDTLRGYHSRQGGHMRRGNVIAIA